MNDYDYDYDFDDDDWYDDDSIHPHPEDYDGPSCGRCYDRMGIPRRFGRGERACPSCNPGPIRRWWWRNIGRRWWEWRTRRWHRLLKPGNFDDVAPF